MPNKGNYGNVVQVVNKVSVEKLSDLDLFILKLILKEKVALNTFITKKAKEKHFSRFQVYRSLKKLKKLGLIKETLISGHLKSFEVVDRLRTLDLIVCAPARNLPHILTHNQKTNLTTDFKQLITSCLLPSLRASWLWRELNPLRLKSKLDELEQEKVKENFELYINNVAQKVLIFKDADDEYHIKKYRTRFTDKSKAIEIAKTLEEAFNIASYRYHNAVFLTLTLPPVFPFRIQNWILSFLLHRIKALIRKRTEKTKPHVKAIEPQSLFLIHNHVVIFGIDFLMPKHQLTEYLEKHLINFLSNLGNHYKRTINKRATEEQINALNILGKQLLKRYNRYKKRTPNYVGPINWITKIKIEENVYVFENPPPDRKQKTTANDGGMVSVLDYIKFYTIKNLQEVKIIQEAIEEGKPVKPNNVLAFYWFLRLPFYTLSPKLRTPKPKPKPKGWTFIFSCDLSDLDDLGLGDVLE